MTVKKGEQLTKRVKIVAKDDAEQIATGIVMVPNAVDRQHDYVRPDTIEGFADQFGNLYEAGESSNGVMHAAFPDEHATLERNDVLDESATIGGESVDAGAWVQSWRITDTELWELVADDILGAYSIGAVDVTWNGPYDVSELDDEIRVPDEIDTDEPVWELVDGLVREVSMVDIPAVPDAQILETKAEAEKALADHLGNRDGFIEEAIQRGHAEADAERLWDYLNRAVDIEGAGDPGKQSMFARAGKAFLSALSSSDDDSTTATRSSEALGSTAKEGRTLSAANRDALFASIDAQLGVLDDAGVDHGTTRFTDRDDVNFDLAEYTGKAAPTDKDAPGGDTPDDDTTTMSDDDPMADAPEWGKALYDQTEKNSDRIDTLADKVSADPDDPEKAWEDAPAWAKALRDEQEKNREDITDLAEASGKSQQLSGDSKESNDESNRSKADVLGLPGGEH